MIEIMCDFLNDEFNQADKFKNIIEDKRVFRMQVPDNKETEDLSMAYSAFDYITRNNFIVVFDNYSIVKDVVLMRILIHEFGHIADNFDKEFVSRKELAGYFWMSGYTEVYSMMYEKLFLDYLIKNNMFKEGANWNLKDFYLSVYDGFNGMEYLSSLDNNLLVNERYKTERGIIDQITVDDEGNINLDKDVFVSFDDSNKYSYGGLIAQYFAELKHNDIDKYNKCFESFKNRRFNMFYPGIFEDIGTNPDEIIKIYEKGLNDVSVKKLILS